GNNNTIAVYENATPLIVALTESSAATASTLLTRGANINASIRKLRFTTNRQLDYRDSENLTEAYLRENFTMNYEADGWTPLMEAVESGQSDLVILLLRQGADRNASTKQGLTALKLAQQMKFTDIARILQ
ncbi:MAG: ankyrin repeat domain-containing protein, partial [Bacteroidota bacterium]